MRRSQLTAWVFVVAGLLFLVAGAMPLMRGQRGNLTFLVLAIALMLIGAAISKKGRVSTTIPDKEL